MIVYIRTASNNFLCECVILTMYIRMVSIPYDKNKIEGGGRGGGSMPNVGSANRTRTFSIRTGS